MQHKLATALYIGAGLLVVPAVFMLLLGDHLARSVVLWYNPIDGSHRGYEELFRWTTRIVASMNYWRTLFFCTTICLLLILARVLRLWARDRARLLSNPPASASPPVA